MILRVKPYAVPAEGGLVNENVVASLKVIEKTLAVSQSIVAVPAEDVIELNSSLREVALSSPTIVTSPVMSTLPVCTSSILASKAICSPSTLEIM